MLKRFQFFMGPAALRALFLWIALTGLFSLILNVIVDQYAWVRAVQTLLAWAAVIGAIVIILSRVDPLDRRRWIAVLAPAVGAVILAFTVLPQFQLALFGGALGWVVFGLLLFRTKTPPAYKQAIRHLRRSELDQAVKVMDQLIREEPDDPNHYRFRAELLRVWGKLDRARRDYQRMIELLPDSAVAYNGLAEVDLQAGKYPDALTAAQRAAELAPDEWVALYNLGMIQDRLHYAEAAIASLTRADTQKIPDARHRLLIQFYLARAYARLNRLPDAAAAVDQLKRLAHGLEEWKKLMESEQAETLRKVLAADIAQIEELIAGTTTPAALAVDPPPVIAAPVKPPRTGKPAP